MSGPRSGERSGAALAAVTRPARDFPEERCDIEVDGGRVAVFARGSGEPCVLCTATRRATAAGAASSPRSRDLEERPEEVASALRELLDVNR